MEKIQKNKILGIDYGDFYIGLAIFDLSVDFIYPYKTLIRDKENVLRKTTREIRDIIIKEDIGKIVIGLPLNYDGTEGERVEKVKVFSHMLENKLKEKTDGDPYIKDIEIVFQDERLTTKEASSILTKRGVKKENQKEVLDQLAAEIILKDYREVMKK